SRALVVGRASQVGRACRDPSALERVGDPAQAAGDCAAPRGGRTASGGCGAVAQVAQPLLLIGEGGLGAEEGVVAHRGGSLVGWWSGWRSAGGRVDQTWRRLMSPEMVVART